MTDAPRPIDLLAPDIGGKQWTEPVLPEPHGLMIDVDAALRQHILNVSQRLRETDVYQRREADHFS